MTRRRGWAKDALVEEFEEGFRILSFLGCCNLHWQNLILFLSFLRVHFCMWALASCCSSSKNQSQTHHWIFLRWLRTVPWHAIVIYLSWCAGNEKDPGYHGKSCTSCLLLFFCFPPFGITYFPARIRGFGSMGSARKTCLLLTQPVLGYYFSVPQRSFWLFLFCYICPQFSSPPPPSHIIFSYSDVVRAAMWRSISTSHVSYRWYSRFRHGVHVLYIPAL